MKIRLCKCTANTPPSPLEPSLPPSCSCLSARSTKWFRNSQRPRIFHVLSVDNRTHGGRVHGTEKANDGKVGEKIEILSIYLKTEISAGLIAAFECRSFGEVEDIACVTTRTSPAHSDARVRKTNPPVKCASNASERVSGVTACY